VPARRAAFLKGIRRAGLECCDGLPKDPRPGDVFITWNRIGAGNTWAREFEKRGWPVLVVENATWGNDFAGDRWYHLALRHHNTAGRFPVGGPERWDGLGVSLPPMRQDGETVILLQRGIGSAPVRMPGKFLAMAHRDYPRARIRKHPGTRPGVPLLDDLRKAGQVVTWGSGAALVALMAGIRVRSYYPKWIAAQDNTEAGRLDMLRRLAWSQWTLDEIASGKPIRRLLKWSGSDE
jgi:hypothetical protein